MAAPAAQGSSSNTLPKSKRPGKKSAQKHMDAFRKRKNVEALKEIHGAAKERTFIHLDEQLAILKDLKIDRTPTTAQVPITTRGIGFLSNEIFDYVHSQCPKAFVGNTYAPINFYRIGLLQLGAQQHMANALHSNIKDMLFEDDDYDLDTDLMEAVKASTSKTIKPLSIVAETAGLVTVGENQYLTYVPVVPARSADEVVSVGKKRRVETINHTVPHPFFVTAKNAREYVEALSPNGGSTDAERTYFRSNNPIPGADWDDDNTLLNADDLFPPGWPTVAQARREVKLYNQMMSNITCKCASILGPIAIDGKGHPSIFASEFQFGARILNDGRLDFDTYPNTYRCTMNIDTVMLVKGGLTLLGEYPVDCPFWQPNYAFDHRSPTASVYRQDFQWTAVLDSVLTKR
jgi:hypothetical protein